MIKVPAFLLLFTFLQLLISLPAAAQDSWLSCFVLTKDFPNKPDQDIRNKYDTPGTDNDRLTSMYSRGLYDKAWIIANDLQHAVKTFKLWELPAPELEKVVRHSEPPAGCISNSDIKPWEAYLGKIENTSSSTDKGLAYYQAKGKTIHLHVEKIFSQSPNSIVAKISAPHELFHAIHQSYNKYNNVTLENIPKWVREGVAEMAAMEWLRQSPSGKWKPTSRGTGSRRYDIPLFRPDDGFTTREYESYMTSSFWRYILKNNGGWNSIKNILSRKLQCNSADLTSKSCEKKSIQWLDEGPDGKGQWLFTHYPKFIAYFSTLLKQYPKRLKEIYSEQPVLSLNTSKTYVESKKFDVLAIASKYHRVDVSGINAGTLVIDIDPSIPWSDRQSLHLIVDDQVYRFPYDEDPGPIASPLTDTIAPQNRTELDLSAINERSFTVMVANVSRQADSSETISGIKVRAYLESDYSATPGSQGSRDTGKKYKAARLGRNKSGRNVPRAGDELDTFGSVDGDLKSMDRIMALSLLPLKNASDEMGPGPFGMKLMTFGIGTGAEIYLPYVPLGQTGSFPAAIRLIDDDGSRFGKRYRGVSLGSRGWEWSGTVTLDKNTKDVMSGSFSASGINVETMNNARITGPFVPDEAQVDISGNFNLVWSRNDDPDPAIMATDNLGMGSAQKTLRQIQPDNYGYNSPTTGSPTGPGSAGSCNEENPLCQPSALENEYRELLIEKMGRNGALPPGLIEGMVKTFRMMSPDLQRQTIDMLRE